MRREIQERFSFMRRPVRRTDNLTTCMCRLSWNLGAWISWNSQGLSRPVQRLLYLYLQFYDFRSPHMLNWEDIRMLIILPLMSHQPLVGQGLLIIESSWSYSGTPQAVGFLWTSDQPHAETSSWQHTTFTRDRHPWPRQDLNPQSQQTRVRRPTL